MTLFPGDTEDYTEKLHPIKIDNDITCVIEALSMLYKRSPEMQRRPIRI